jgi:hypothetical protein
MLPQYTRHTVVAFPVFRRRILRNVSILHRLSPIEHSEASFPVAVPVSPSLCVLVSVVCVRE